MMNPSDSIQPGLRRWLILVLVIGILLRFVWLDRKAYWHDETYTSLWLSGHSSTAVREAIFDGGVTSVAALQTYQRISPEVSVSKAIQSLVEDEPQHPPLYYALAQLWGKSVGDSVPAIRAFSALMGVLALPCLYWLCWELFQSSRVGWIAIALAAISPAHLLYAQEARSYSFWLTTILFSSAALLWAMRQPTRRTWGVYTGSLILGLYCHLFSFLTIAFHGLYVLVVLVAQQFRSRRRAIAFGISVLLSIIAFLPWLLQTDEISAAGWTSMSLPMPVFLQLWGLNFSRIFLDGGFELRQPPSYLLFLGLVGVAIASAIYTLRTQAPKRSQLFLFTITVVPAAFLLLPDLILGGQRSVVFRYVIPFVVGIQIAIAYLFAHNLGPSIKLKRRRIWQLLLIFAIALGTLSCIKFVRAETWWHKFFNNDNIPIAQIVSAEQRPLLISDALENSLLLGNALSLSHSLPPETHFQFLPTADPSQISPQFDTLFLWNPTQTLIQQLQASPNYTLEPTYLGNYQTLLRLKPVPGKAG